jgi:hypothetical protein
MEASWTGDLHDVRHQYYDLMISQEISGFGG